jgi:hypothetical protein
VEPVQRVHGEEPADEMEPARSAIAAAVRARELNGELQSTFIDWYPGLDRETES